MTGGLHKLTAGDGYLYLIRQVASYDAHRGYSSLGAYYSEKGESPGRWVGAGLAGLAGQKYQQGLPEGGIASKHWAVEPGSEVTEDQMKALYGEGLHPNATQISLDLVQKGLPPGAAENAAKLGKKFLAYDEENEWARRLYGAYADYNAAAGQRSNEPIEPEIKAEIRTALGRDMFAEEYGRGPADDRELSGYLARVSRSATAVAGYDFTFTPVKSASVLWALAPRSMSEAIEKIQQQAVRDVLGEIEDQVCFTRRGTEGVQQVKAEGIIAAMFQHRDSRAGDPNLHTHVAISNKVSYVGADGIRHWLALDGTPLHHATVALSELYNTRFEQLCTERLGLRFESRESDTAAKRPVREIVGIAPELIELWSSRRHAIETRAGDLAKEFQAKHGREPSAVEWLALSQQATLETRQGKHEARSLGEQRQTWRAEAVAQLGGHRAVTNMVAEATRHTRTRRARVPKEWIKTQAHEIIETIAQDRSRWTVNHVRAEARRRVRYTDHLVRASTENDLIRAALTQHCLVITSHADTEMGEPQLLRRPDGASVYTRHDTTLYTTAAVLAAERRILAAAGRTGGRVIDDAELVTIAILKRAAEAGFDLNDGQKLMVRDMATSGARVQLALAPAGTGKTTAMAALAEAWRSSGGNVVGLAPTAAAAEVLGEDLDSTTDTIDKLIQLGGDSVARNDPALAWYDSIGPTTLLIVDEAAKASTEGLDAVIALALSRGASVRLIGDDKQLSSVAAGGVISDIAREHDALTLSTVVRFTDPETGVAEGAASLALRNGDPAGLAHYIDHGRVHVAAEGSAADAAYAAWIADQDGGVNSILTAPTNDIVTDLNMRVRLHRLHGRAAPSRTTTLGDGLTASVGDWIITRNNARWLRLGTGGWVKNGHRWVIKKVKRDGSLVVTSLLHSDDNRTVTLPAKYVAAHTTLGYASTIDTVQGVTADVCRIVATDHLSRPQLYVALTRGSQQNHVYLSTAESDPHRIIAPKAVTAPTAVDLLSTVLRKDGDQKSALTAIAAEADPIERLGLAARMYADALGAAAEHRLGQADCRRLDEAAETVHAGLAQAPAWAVLRRNLALIALDGHDPIHALVTSKANREIDTARDPAAVLDWRLFLRDNERLFTPGPLPWISDIPAALRQDQQWGGYLIARANLVDQLAGEVRAAALEWTARTAPEWARPLIGGDPELMADIAVFRAAHNVDPADTRLTGPGQLAAMPVQAQQRLLDRLDARLRRRGQVQTRWDALAEKTDPHMVADPFWPTLTAHFEEAERAGTDVAGLVRAALDQHGPLPDELPAAALWWRLAGSLGSSTLSQANARLQPDWTAELHGLLGTAATEIVITDPRWPALVTAVSVSDWPAADLLAAAVECLRDIQHTQYVAPEEYARLLTYRIEFLAHRGVTLDADVPHPADDIPTQQVDAEQLNLFEQDKAHPAAGHPAYEDPSAPAAPDPEDHAHDSAADELAGLDFEDLPRTRPAGPTDPARLDITDLRRRREHALRAVADLSSAVGSGQGPAAQDAAGLVNVLQARYDHQAPARARFDAAHRDWIAGAHTADLHHALIEQLGDAITRAARNGHSADVQTLQSRRLESAHQSPDIDRAAAAAEAARGRAHAALVEAAGGEQRIVSAGDIDNVRRRAQALDERSLAEARVDLARLGARIAVTETAAGSAFAHGAMRRDPVAGERVRLGVEVEWLSEAGSRSPAANYRCDGVGSVQHLDDAGRRAVTGIAQSWQTVQPLRAAAAEDKPALLTALGDTARTSRARVLSITGSPEAAATARTLGYADTTTGPTEAIERLDSGQWTLPLGSLVIVDDADHLDADQLRALTRHASDANTKVVLLTHADSATEHGRDGQSTGRDLTDAAGAHLPWAQHLGTQPAYDTALNRAQSEHAEHARNTDAATSDLLHRATTMLNTYRDLHDPAHGYHNRGQQRGRAQQAERGSSTQPAGGRGAAPRPPAESYEPPDLGLGR